MSDRIDKFPQLQKTLLLPLWGRTKYEDLLNDSKAMEVVRKINYDFQLLDKCLSPISSLIWAVRAKVLDDEIKKYIEKYPNATVVSLGCGLETTFYRVDNGKIIWYDLDVPDVITLKNEIIGLHERVHYITKSFNDLSWLDNIDKDNELLIIAEGLFLFFEQETIIQFLNEVSSKRNCTILFDAYSKVGNKFANDFFTSSGLHNVKVKLLINKKILNNIKNINHVEVIPFFKNYKNIVGKNKKEKRFMRISDLTKASVCYKLCCHKEMG